MCFTFNHGFTSTGVSTSPTYLVSNDKVKPYLHTYLQNRAIYAMLKIILGQKMNFSSFYAWCTNQHEVFFLIIAKLISTWSLISDYWVFLISHVGLSQMYFEKEGGGRWCIHFFEHAWLQLCMSWENFDIFLTYYLLV